MFAYLGLHCRGLENLFAQTSGKRFASQTTSGNVVHVVPGDSPFVIPWLLLVTLMVRVIDDSSMVAPSVGPTILSSPTQKLHRNHGSDLGCSLGSRLSLGVDPSMFAGAASV